MRTETYTVTEVYFKYDELSEDAKEKVKDMFLDWRQYDSDIFTEDCELNLSELFPNSDLHVEYDLGYCQGDGLNIYGDLDLSDVLKHIDGDFTKDELRFLKWAIAWHNEDYKMPNNTHYSYCICEGQEYTEDIESDMHWNRMRYGEKQENIMQKFNELAGEYMASVANELEEYGYHYFYEIEEDDIEDSCEANGYEFFEDGTLAH